MNADASDDRAALRAVLDGLLVGAAQPMEAVGEWAARLIGDHPTPVASRFVNQLGDEWFDAPPPDDFCARIRDEARARIAAWHPGWPHLWAHVLRVTGVAVALAEDAGVDPPLAYVMGMCHDVAKLDETRDGVPHEETGATFAGRVLRGHLPPTQIESIQAAILKTGGDALARILSDADKLDKIGAAGILRRVSVETDRRWLPLALARVRDEARWFPPMRFDLSRDLAQQKQAFLAWFLPLAEQAISGE
jgi:HD superfamily phosphodiesterase